MFAIIKTGGKQYLVKKGDKVKIEKIEGEIGTQVEFPEVLFWGGDKEVKVGMPLVKDVKVEGKILGQAKAKKVTGIKHKPKKRYKVKFGHRQMVTEVEITKI
ncbi:MAG: 50S ribosomal protein L21 [Candidatus Moranbacteria bacterium]|nr:50S ribosomal protein L21 [Candidatus Moranbacteria bacterium]